MLLITKAVFGLGATLVLATAYTFREGVIRVDVDENCLGGSHIHVWVPARVVSAGLHLTPRQDLEQAAEQVRPYLPVLREVSKELEKYPNAELVDVEDGTDHIHVAMVKGKLRIDANQGDEQHVHVTIPVRVIRDVADRLEEVTPTI